jgi:wyosine [tRNA(Phe)-imidazoG37] synthetase (radical SAM superfamily)
VARLQEELTALIGLVRSGDFTRQSRFSGLDDLIQEIRDIAFSGDGEPTMATNFVQCMAAVAAVKRAEGLDQVKIVLITNGAGLDRADVRSGLEILDANQGEIWGKLDAGTEPYFRLVNRTSIRFERILLNLLETARARPIVIQSLFLKVHGEIIPAAELEEYCQRLNELVQAAGRIKEVHAYTVARPTPEPFAAKLSAAELETLAAIIRQRTRLVVKCFP